MLTDAQNQSRSSRDAHRRSQSYGGFYAAEMLSVISREGVWRGQSRSIVVNTAFVLSRCKINAECYFLFMLFFVVVALVKTKLLLSEQKQALSRSLIKAKWHKANFLKVGDTCTVLTTKREV